MNLTKSEDFLIFVNEMSNLNILINLRKLVISARFFETIFCFQSFVYCLNKFTKLEQLAYNYHLINCAKLSHPNLRSIFFNNCENLEVFEIDCVKLESIKYFGNFLSFKIKHPESIKHIDCSYHADIFNLSQFKSLESIYFPVEHNLNMCVHNLKVLEFIDDNDLIDCVEEALYNRDSLIDIIKQKQILRKDDLRIYWVVIEILNEIKLESYLNRLKMNLVKWKSIMKLMKMMKTINLLFMLSFLYFYLITLVT